MTMQTPRRFELSPNVLSIARGDVIQDDALAKVGFRGYASDERPFYTVRSLAKRLALSERTVRDMLRWGRIASYKVEGARRVDPADVDVYLAQRREEAVA